MIVARTSLAKAKVVPWANGRGETRELLRLEGADGALLLRLSVADVVEPGPFSALPGIDRLLTLIEGPGFDLSIDGRRVAVRHLAPVAFAGEAAVSATVVPGPSRDFNVMTGRARMAASVTVHRGAFTAGEGKRFLFVVAGVFGVRGETLAAGDLAELRIEPDATLAVDGEGALLAIAVRGA